MNDSQNQTPTTPIILIGPMSTGKTTIAGLLAKRLGLTHYELDDLRWDYYAEIGYDHTLASKIRQTKGFGALLRYWKQFELHAVERVLQEHADGVISFGAGHSVYEDEAQIAHVEELLHAYNNVILLLPNADPEQSIQILEQRFYEIGETEGFTPSPELTKINARFVEHPSNRRLAKQIFYTDGQTPEQTCTTILEQLDSRPQAK